MRLFLLPWKRILYNYELKSCDMFLDVSFKRVGEGEGVWVGWGGGLHVSTDTGAPI